MLYYIKLQYELPSNPRIIFGGLKGLFIEFLELYMCNCSSNDNIHGSDYLLIFNDAQKFDEAKQIMNEESAFNNSKIIFGNISSPEMKLQLQMNTIKINGKTTKNTDIIKRKMQIIILCLMMIGLEFYTVVITILNILKIIKQTQYLLELTNQIMKITNKIFIITILF